MTYRTRSRWRLFPDPSTRRAHNQVVNVYVEGQRDLTPADPTRAEGLLERMSPLRLRQRVPMIGERVTPDVSPDLRDFK